MNPKIRILIVEDEQLFADLLKRTLSNEPGLEVVDVAYGAKSALEMDSAYQPDAVLMDIELPSGTDGLAAAIQIKEARPDTGMVVLSAHGDRRYITSLPLDASSGWAFLLKQTVPDVATVVRAIQGSIHGMMVLDPLIVKGLHPRQGSALALLTPRRRQVLELIAQGYNNAAIAETLVITQKSVETYINAIYQDLGVSREQGIHSRVRATPIYLEDSQNR